MFTIEKEFHFCASHYLRDHESPCKNMHGHNFVVVLILQSHELDETGFVREFRELDEFKRFLDETLDHKTLNDVAPFDAINPTTEHMAYFLFCIARKMFPELAAVRVSETPKTWVCYRP